MGQEQATPMDRQGHGWSRALRVLLQAVHSPEYLDAKARDFGAFTLWALLITAVFVLGMIPWDYAIDATRAWHVVWLRVMQCGALLFWAIASVRYVHGRAARIAALAAPLFIEATFMVVLDRLDGGTSYGMGGFLYFFIFAPFLLLAQPLGLAALVLTAITVFPPLAAWFGLQTGLDWWIYAAYMGTGFVPVLAIRLLLEVMYWHVFRYRREVEHQALTDGLTRLPNRRQFLAAGMRSLDSHGESGQPASLLFIDIDRFKGINDTHGHRTGDAAICHVAHALRALCREEDLMARYGGEEFLVLLPRTGPAAAAEIAERLRSAVVAAPFPMPDARASPLGLTVSIGIASYDPHDLGDLTDIDRLIHAADRAVYVAKRGGRNRVVSVGDGPAPDDVSAQGRS
ncbi:GGDEF domain-containing protein [Salinisphaera orenii]|uniref:diguanylate cyclase n=1 Tax=Salinisphaera orenii YIM 95161 TaxID=1051139 RepID=A0A423Q2U9_9GAMM|nr:GGDEF domain-containing protein [Salinisphaera halophila]ROO32939.1 diguanylate cyclase [Salinisphaera halophila YIM 95161]